MKLLLLTHGRWGVEILNSMKMILGDVSYCYSIPLTADLTFGDYEELIRKEIEVHGKPIVILTDVYGGTTTHVAMKLLQEFDFELFSGFNMPVCLEVASSLTYTDELDIPALLSIGKDSIMDVKKMMKEKNMI